ncbi:RND family efflux transporter MFP subunit [Anaerobacterium chartisolvens]|uniref:RND family efflux transporter MFP subunit n=1 Tax=Anaerobacterium chartisolvens TaxID=1297424 RepID=A0A369BMC3_9FIRM|nr:efflux RND transporter periplasmic adaptor subunit [Anaerobacterium chartisolvens]RCX20844.1 RND family efflux transporter MFP subunit [Anaerobacterium chartisolvens]
MSKVRLKAVITISAVTVIIFGVIFLYGELNAVGVNVHVASPGELMEYVEVRGKVELDSKEKIYSKVDGRIKSVLVKEGERVGTGDELAQIDVDDLELSIKKAQAAYEETNSKLGELRRSIESEEVTIAKAKMDQAGVAVRTARESYNYKEDLLQKTRALLKDGAVSQQDVKQLELDFETSKNLLDAAEHEYTIAEQNYKLLSKGIKKESIDSVQAAVEQSKLQIQELSNQLGRVDIRPNINGVVIQKNIDVNSSVQSGFLLFEVGDYNSAYIKANVLTDDVGKIEIGQKAVISGELLSKKEIDGVVYYIAPKAETSVSSIGVEQQRIEIRVKFDNSKFNFRPGYGVDVKVITSEKQSVLYVPNKSVFDSEGKDSVFIVKGNELELKNVEKGIENKDYIEVVNGINDGEKVVADPNSTLKLGTKVKIK